MKGLQKEISLQKRDFKKGMSRAMNKLIAASQTDS